MEEKTMQGNCCASFSDQSWNSIASGKSSDGGLRNKRRKKFVAPKCHCRTYAILFQSSTIANPNRLFFGCSNFKTSTPHCRFFAWLDEYVAASSMCEATDITQESDSMRKLEEKMVSLEKIVAEGNKGKRVNFKGKCVGLGFFFLGN
ncbi:hypothetical protein PIB30_019975 [Stylosanthes scabra]|uniref:GRF-type domain-containing protein n=1 Tax=Stylosanthes scabra TaxID=79078 RepID=A0ABU6Y810_9FABA|nr:hypothetical protein [Stylosanthes scabra]